MPSRVLEFLKFDTESSVGQLVTSKPDCLWSMKEAKAYIRSTYGECYSTADESKILEYMDANGSGMISVIEFKDFQLEFKREVELQCLDSTAPTNQRGASRSTHRHSRRT